MVLEPIGALFVLAGFVCLLGAEAIGIFTLLTASLLGASTGLFLTFAGNANVQPAHLLLVFLAVDLVIRRSSFLIAVNNLAFPRAGFWLLLTLTYGAVITVFMPRLFAGF